MYLNINLLPRDLRPKKSLIALDFRTTYTILVVLGAVALGWYYFQVQGKIAAQDAELANLRQQEALLQDAVNLQSEVNTLRENVAARVGVIRELTGGSDLRFAMFQYLNEIAPANLWLLRISEQNDNEGLAYAIEGMSYSKQDISAFLGRLQEYEQFSSVRLESIRPAPMEIRDAYQYSVLVRLTNQQPDGPATAAR